MHKEIKVASYESEEYSLLPKKDNPYTGRIYGVQYGDYLKIGSSSNVRDRIKALKCQARYSGVLLRVVVVSAPHSNYKQNEKELQTIFSEKRIKKTELFNISLEDFVFELNKRTFLNNSKELQKVSNRTACFVADYFHCL